MKKGENSFTLMPGEPKLLVEERGNFTTRIVGKELLWNIYDCEHCLDEGKTHDVHSYASGQTDSSSCWGAGVPTTIRVCSGCGRWDGGWVSADHVGGGY